MKAPVAKARKQKKGEISGLTGKDKYFGGKFFDNSEFQFSGLSEPPKDFNLNFRKKKGK